ncbi:MAG TPA: aminotransferase class IV [Thermoplasmata archaeon]
MPVDDLSFLSGDGAFETIRISEGAPFRFGAHLLRLMQSLKALGLPPRPSAELHEAAKTILQAAGVEEGLLRITVTAPDTHAGHGGHVVLTLRPLPRVPERIVLHVAEDCRRVPGPLSRAKTLSRALEAKALREAREVGAFDAILLNTFGRLVETTARNLFLVTAGVLRTPSLEEGALPGITREAVLELAKGEGLPAREEPIPREDLFTADEAFLTGSGVGILGVSRIGSAEFVPVPGAWTARLAQAYRGLLAQETTRRAQELDQGG